MVAMFLKGMAGPRYKTLATLGGALLAAVLLAAYANHFYNSFHFDDVKIMFVCAYAWNGLTNCAARE